LPEDQAPQKVINLQIIPSSPLWAPGAPGHCGRHVSKPKSMKPSVTIIEVFFFGVRTEDLLVVSSHPSRR